MSAISRALLMKALLQFDTKGSESISRSYIIIFNNDSHLGWRQEIWSILFKQFCDEPFDVERKVHEGQSKSVSKLDEACVGSVVECQDRRRSK